MCSKERKKESFTFWKRNIDFQKPNNISVITTVSLVKVLLGQSRKKYFHLLKSWEAVLCSNKTEYFKITKELK